MKGSVVLVRNPRKTGTTVMEAPRAVKVEWNREQPRFSWEWRKPTSKALRAPWATGHRSWKIGAGVIYFSP